MPLPTKTDAVFVRPTSIQVPEGMTELRHLRTEKSKTVLHAEKAADGKEIRTCEVRMGSVCYRDDDGSLRSIDTTIRDLGESIGVEWAPYRFSLHAIGIGFDFESREGGSVSVTLSGIGGERFDQDTPLKPDITDNVITFREVRPGCDIVFKCLNQRVKTLRILRDENAPRTFEWSVISDKPELIDNTLFGKDAAGNQLELVASADGMVITETWTGKTKVILDPATRIRTLSDDVAYPVEIDPTVNSSIDTGADDMFERESDHYVNTNGNSLYFGKAGAVVFDPGFHLLALTIPQGSTITSATLTFKVRPAAGTAIASGKIYAELATNPARLSGSHLITSAVKTTAFTSVTTAAGTNNVDVTAQMQELVNQGGWASGDAANLFGIGTGATYTTLCSTEYDAPNEASISVTYTAAAAGGTANNLLLLGCG